MEKKYCDECGKEIKHDWKSFYGSRWTLWGLIPYGTSGDLCSIKCLKKFVEKL